MAVLQGYKCTTLNVRGLNDRDKRNKVFKWLKDNQSDIIFLQETFCTEQFEEYFKSNWRGHIVHAFSDSKHSRGVCIMFSERCNINVGKIHRSQDGRRLLVNAKLDDTAITLVCIYAPNDIKSCKEFFKKTNKFINHHAENDSDIVCAGDFNCC